VGWVERVKIYPGEMVLKAKVDTGAKNSSISARHVSEFTRDGQAWVRFDVNDTRGNRLELERPLEREAKVRRHFGRRQTRPVVKLGVCLGTIYKDVEVTLVNREGFLYPMLIGRSFLKGEVLIDVSATFTQDPSCRGNDKDG
jgi:hypothetical protein